MRKYKIKKYQPRRSALKPAPKLRRSIIKHDITEYRRRDTGALHRKNGPAVVTTQRPKERPVAEEWFLNGQRHRPDGPAVVRSALHRDGAGREWWLDGLPLTEAQFNARQVASVEGQSS